MEVFQRQCTMAAKARWREVVQKIGVENLAAQELAAIAEMGSLNDYLLDADDAADVRREEECRHWIKNPRPFVGFAEKKG